MKDNLALIAVVGLGLFFLMRSKANAGNVPTMTGATPVIAVNPTDPRPLNHQVVDPYMNTWNWSGNIQDFLWSKGIRVFDL